MSLMTSIPIALALVWKGPLLLIAQRQKSAHLGEFWEFPGGRIEDGENAKVAAVREVHEETGIRCTALILRPSFDFEYPDRKIAFYPVDCAWVSGEPQAFECLEPRWVSETEIARYVFPAANAALLREIGQRWSSKF